MSDKVDEAVATALLGMQDHLTGIPEVDDFINQSFITLGGMVKISALAGALEISPPHKAMVELMLQSYTSVITRIVFELTRGSNA
jgi:hypothetical protein